MSADNVNDSVRDEFRKLDLDAKTSFLVEAIFSTAGSAINEIGSRLNGLVGLVTQPFEDDGSDSESAAVAEDQAETEEQTGDSTPPRSQTRAKKSSGSKKK